MLDPGVYAWAGKSQSDAELYRIKSQSTQILTQIVFKEILKRCNCICFNVKPFSFNLLVLDVKLKFLMNMLY